MSDRNHLPPSRFPKWHTAHRWQPRTNNTLHFVEKKEKRRLCVCQGVHELSRSRSQLGRRIMEAHNRFCIPFFCFQVGSPALPRPLVQLAFKSTDFHFGSQRATVNHLHLGLISIPASPYQLFSLPARLMTSLYHIAMHP